MRTVVKDSQLLGIKDQWCREMAKQASHDAEEIEARIRVIRQSPEVTRALGKEIARLQRIKEELERDIHSWAG